MITNQKGADITPEGRIEVVDIGAIALEILRGNTFSGDTSKSLANQEVYDIVIRVGSDTGLGYAALLSIESGYQCQVDIYKDPTESGGNVVSQYNNNDTSTNTPVTVIVTAPTVTSPGTLVTTKVIGFTGKGGDTAGGTSGTYFPYGLKVNTKYLYRVTSLAASNQISANSFIIESPELAA